SRRRHTRFSRDWSSDVCSSDLDTADVYGNGLSEEILGRAMRGNRQGYVVATKIGWIGYDGEAGRSAFDSVAKVTAAAEACLKRRSEERRVGQAARARGSAARRR